MFSTHEAQIRILEHGAVSEKAITYPDSQVVTPRLFYQTAVADWAAKPARPVSLRQLAFFGRRLSRDKLLLSANYIAEEMTIRLAHRLYDMQQMPYSIMTTPHLTAVYEKYSLAFDKCRRFGEIKTTQDNERFLRLIVELLDEHGQVIPDLVLGIKEVIKTGLYPGDPERLDTFVKNLLTSRISRRVIAEQHYSLCKTFAQGITNDDKDHTYIGEVFLQCNAAELIDNAVARVSSVLVKVYGEDKPLPEFVIEGDAANTTFPALRSHIDYILGELLRNSAEATMKMAERSNEPPKPIIISVSSAADNVFIRVSDQGGGIPPGILNNIWSFVKPSQLFDEIGESQLASALPDEVRHEVDLHMKTTPLYGASRDTTMEERDGRRKLGIGLALARIYAEYWDGALEIHSLEGYGCDSLLRLSKLGNRLENLNVNRL